VAGGIYGNACRRELSLFTATFNPTEPTGRWASTVTPTETPTEAPTLASPGARHHGVTSEWLVGIAMRLSCSAHHCGMPTFVKGSGISGHLAADALTTMPEQRRGVGTNENAEKSTLLMFELRAPYTRTGRDRFFMSGCLGFRRTDSRNAGILQDSGPTNPRQTYTAPLMGRSLETLELYHYHHSLCVRGFIRDMPHETRNSYQPLALDTLCYHTLIYTSMHRSATVNWSRVALTWWMNWYRQSY
jgi:hypothetical protein